MVKSQVPMISLNLETKVVSYNRGKYSIDVPGVVLGVTNQDDLQAFVAHHGSINKACKAIVKVRDELLENAKLFKEYRVSIINGDEVIREFVWPVIGRSKLYFGVETPVGELWMPINHDEFSKEQVVVKNIEAFTDWLSRSYKCEANYFVEVQHLGVEAALAQKTSAYTFKYILNEWNNDLEKWVEKGRYNRRSKLANSQVRETNGVLAVPFWLAKHSLVKGGAESLVTFKKIKIDDLLALLKMSV